MTKKKQIKFTTKIFHDNKVYLKLSDVAKALNYHKQLDFINDSAALMLLKICYGVLKIWMSKH